MPVKIFIFGRDKRLFYLIGNFIDRNKKAFFAGIFHQQAAVAGIKPGGYLWFIFFQLAIIGKRDRIFKQGADNNDNDYYRKKQKRT